MKLIVVFCFMAVILKVLKRSLKFSWYLKAYRDRLPLLSDSRVYEQMLGDFRQLAREIFLWLVIASFCVITLAWVI
jgi:hypothetical protein